MKKFTDIRKKPFGNLAKLVLVIFLIQEQRVLLHTMRVHRSCLPTDMPFEFLKSVICTLGDTGFFRLQGIKVL